MANKIGLLLSAPRTPPRNVTGVVLSSSTISLNWDPPAVEDQNGIIRYYIVNVTEVPTGSIFQLTANGTALSVSLLHPSYVYKITVSAVTIRPGPFSTNIKLRTSEEGKRMEI